MVTATSTRPHAVKSITVAKVAPFPTRDEVARIQLIDCVRKSLSSLFLNRGWKANDTFEIDTKENENGYQTTVTIEFSRSGERDRNFSETTDKQWDDIKRRFLQAAKVLNWSEVETAITKDSEKVTVQLTTEQRDILIKLLSDAKVE